MGVWNGWGEGIAFFRALNFQNSEPEIWRKPLFLRNFRDFPQKFRPLENIFWTLRLEIGRSIRHQSIPPLSAGRFYFLDLRKWPLFFRWPLYQRAQRSKKFNLARKFQSRSEFLISLENFNLDVSNSPQKIGPRWVARSKISFSLEIFNLARNLEFF